MITFPELVRRELEAARSSHVEPFNSFHEGYAVLLAEVDDLWDEIKKKSNARSRRRVLEALIQVAATAQRLADDLALSATDLGYVPDDQLLAMFHEKGE